MLDKLKDWLTALMSSTFKGFDDTLKDSAEILSGKISDSTWNKVLDLSSGMKSFCYTIIGICMMIEIAQIASKVDIIKWEHGLKIGIKMVLAKVCIDVSPTFLKACYIQAQNWIIGISSGTSTIGSLAEGKVKPLIEEVDGFGNILGLFLSVFIVLVAIKICGIMIQVMAYGRMFELYVYLAVSPLPCAFMPLGTGDGASISRITGRFFKSFIAVCLQGVMMMVVMNVFDTIIGTAVMDAVNKVDTSDANKAITDLVFTMLLGSITLVISVTKSGSWAKQIIDAM